MGARRAAAASGILLVVAAGLVVALVLPDGVATDIAGDVLYAVAAYLAVVVVAPRRSPIVVAAIAATWCVAVELFQLTGMPERWGAAFFPAMLVFGTVFDPRDLLVYAGAVIVAAVIDAVLLAARRGTWGRSRRV